MQLLFNSLFNSLGWYDWIHFNISFNKSWTQVFGIGLWHIWNSRNKTIFKGYMQRPTTIYKTILVDYMFTNKAFQEKNAATNKEQTQNMKWEKPKAGFVKINTDGCWKSMDHASGGGVIRDDKGNWIVGFSVKFAAKTPEAAELLAIRVGLHIAKDRNFNNIQLETDAEGLKKMLQLSNKFPHHEMGALIHDVEALINHTWRIEILHTRRTANGVAHCIAKFGLTMPEARFIHDTVPDCASKAHLDDIAEPSTAADASTSTTETDEGMVVEMNGNPTDVNDLETSGSGEQPIIIN